MYYNQLECTKASSCKLFLAAGIGFLMLVVLTEVYRMCFVFENECEMTYMYMTPCYIVSSCTYVRMYVTTFTSCTYSGIMFVAIVHIMCTMYVLASMPTTIDLTGSMLQQMPFLQSYFANQICTFYQS